MLKMQFVQEDFFFHFFLPFKKKKKFRLPQVNGRLGRRGLSLEMRFGGVEGLGDVI